MGGRNGKSVGSPGGNHTGRILMEDDREGPGRRERTWVKREDR